MVRCESCGRHMRVVAVCPFCSAPGLERLRAAAVVAMTPFVLAACYGAPPCDAAHTVDADSDGFSTCTDFGYLTDEDCNDADGTINPSAPEICDTIDNNCDGQIDEGCDSDVP